MILLVHLLFGALIGSLVKNTVIAIILAFLSHYFLDVLPHIEYNIEKIREKQWRNKLSAILKVFLDLSLGLLLISIFSKNQPIIYICAFFAILPDGFTILNILIPNKILKAHGKFHSEIIHFLRYKKISNFWRFSSQILVTAISIALLKI